MKIKVGISNRHIHLTKEDYDILFDEDYTILKNLSQPSDFVTDKVVTLKTDKYEIKNVKVLGPFRDYTQVEISRSDAIKFGINPPVRESGDLKDAETITIISEKGEITKKCAIISQRHIHISQEEANKLNLKNKQIVNVKLGKEKKGVIECFVKIKDNAILELHIDTDDASAFIMSQGDEGELLI